MRCAQWEDVTDLQQRQSAARRLARAWTRHQLARDTYDGSDCSRARLRAALIELDAAERAGAEVLSDDAQELETVHREDP